MSSATELRMSYDTKSFFIPQDAVTVKKEVSLEFFVIDEVF